MAGGLVSERVKSLSYAIRELIPLARRLEMEGERILYLNIGDPLRYDFHTPSPILEALCRAVRNGYNFYSASEGLDELREAIAEKERRINGVDVEAEDVIVTHGVSEAINFVMASLVDVGDEVLIPSPAYPLYVNFTSFYGGIPRFYKLVERSGYWRVDVDSLLGSLSARSKAIVVINPNNPTGCVAPREDIERIIQVARDNDLVIISDEIYDRMVFEGSFTSVASLSDDVPVIGLNGFSKTYLVTGWRLGYLYFYDPSERLEEVRSSVVQLARNRLCAVTPVQKALADSIFAIDSYLTEVIVKLRRRRDFLFSALRDEGVLAISKPQGTFYMFPRIEGEDFKLDDREFARRLLLEEKVLVVAGSGFYMHDNRHFRLVFLPREDILEDAAGRILAFIRRHSRG